MQPPTDEDLLRHAFSLLGRRRSPRKAQAARENARKGGRPRGMVVSEETKARISATKQRKRQALAEGDPTSKPAG